MSSDPASSFEQPVAKAGRRRQRARTSLHAHGEPMVWLTGGALALSLLMIAGLLLIVFVNGMATFWPKPIEQVTLRDGSLLMGQFTEIEDFELTALQARDRAPEARVRVLAAAAGLDGDRYVHDLGDDLDAVGLAAVAIGDLGLEVAPAFDPLLAAAAGGQLDGDPETVLEGLSADAGIPFEDLRDLPTLDQRALVTALAAATDLTADRLAMARELSSGIGGPVTRRLLRRGNKVSELYGVLGQWRWIEVWNIADHSEPTDAILIESEESSKLVGFPAALLIDGAVVAEGADAVMQRFAEHHGPSRARAAERKSIEKHEIGALARARNQAGLMLNLAIARVDDQDRRRFALDIDAFWATEQLLAGQFGVVEYQAHRLEGLEGFGAEAVITAIADRLTDIEGLHESSAKAAFLAIGDTLPSGSEEALAASEALRGGLAGVADAALQQGDIHQRVAAVAPAVAEAMAEVHRVRWSTEPEAFALTSRIQELIEENERYQLRLSTVEGKTKDEVLSHIVRVVEPNDGAGAGVYVSRWGEFLFGDPREANSEGGVWPAIFGTVIMTLLMTIVVVPFGVLAALYIREYAKAGVLISIIRIAINNLAGVPSIVFGVFGLGFFCYIVGGQIIDPIFYPEYVAANQPKFGTGGVLWASITLALLTLPVVIVATEEALAAVPSSMREGSYGCGASKWQTIRRIVLPRAMPGIMTGMILAMARGAGEVAPLMLVGAVKLAPELPVELGNWSGSLAFLPTGPLHLERSFMHLGFHIYDVGFQSQDSEAAKPMVYTTTLLLIAIVTALNIFAIFIRSRLRRKFSAGQF